MNFLLFACAEKRFRDLFGENDKKFLKGKLSKSLWSIYMDSNAVWPNHDASWLHLQCATWKYLEGITLSESSYMYATHGWPYLHSLHSVWLESILTIQLKLGMSILCVHGERVVSELYDSVWFEQHEGWKCKSCTKIWKRTFRCCASFCWWEKWKFLEKCFQSLLHK